MKLVIVESPAKIKKIGGYLGQGFRVAATVGHFRDLPIHELAVDLAAMSPTYVINPDKEDVVQRLEAAAAKASEVLIATDPDREGEAIGWHVAQVLGLKHAKRIEFHEITEAAIARAVQNPRPIDQNLVDAQQARRVLDRLVGYKVSPLLQGLGRNLSAGRVQTAALHLVCQRERDRLAFQPEPYWVLKVRYENGVVAELAARDTDKEGKPERPKDEATAAQFAEQAKASPHRVLSISKTEAERRPPAPFTTSTLQQAASSRLGFVPARTMKVAQELFEAGQISYHRTDSCALSDDAVALARGWIAEHQSESLPEKPPSYRSQAGAQEAHEAIRPTSLAWPDELSPDQKALFDLIRTRFLACQMKPARLARTLVLTETPDKALVFAARGTVVLESHWLKLEKDDDGEEGKAKKDRKDELEEQRLPVLQEGQELPVQDIDSSRKLTKPPSRFSEAGLIKEMERLGIGRPSTYAATIDTLYRRSYVVSEKKSLGPTPLGDQVDELMLAGLESLTSHEYTAAMEAELDQIALGKQSWLGYLRTWWGSFEPELARAEKTFGERLAELQARASAGDAGAAQALGRDPNAPTCPECGRAMRKLNGPKGTFWACSGFPGCRKTMPVAAQAPAAKKGEQPAAIVCKQCGKPMIERDGKNGKFLSCSGYPECKQTAPIELTKKRAKRCPKCGLVLTKRKGQKGEFWGCSGFPECRYLEDCVSSKKAAS